MREGVYNGYQVRVAHSIDEVFKDCPYDEGYDLKIGDSHKGDHLEFVDFKEHKFFRHALVFFGGLQGIEGIIEELDENTTLKVSEVRKLFDLYVNSCPERGCRETALRTEESMLISLGAIMPRLRAQGQSKARADIKEVKKEVTDQPMKISPFG